MNPSGIKIIRAGEGDWENAMSLAWLVFSEFNAPVYGEEGSRSFLDFISGNSLKQMFLHGKYPVFLAREDEQDDSSLPAGMLSLRENNHISLLFVDKRYQGKGIGKSLIERAAAFVDISSKEARSDRNKPEDYRYMRALNGRLTVNSAPAAVSFYRSCGFFETGETAQNDGISYVPMMRPVKRGYSSF